MDRNYQFFHTLMSLIPKPAVTKALCSITPKLGTSMAQDQPAAPLEAQTQRRSTCIHEAALVSLFWGPIPENTTHLLSSSDPAHPVWAQSAPSHLGEASCSFSLWALLREREEQKAKGTASTPSESLGKKKGKQLSDIFLLRFLCPLPVFHFKDKN